MALASVIIAAGGAASALVTVLLAYLALGEARKTVTEAQTSRLDAEKAAQDAAQERQTAAADRQAAEHDRQAAAADRREEARDRQRRRLERIGELVEDIFWTAEREQARLMGEAAGEWMALRNRLRHAVVGLRNRLPATGEILNAATASQALGSAAQARNEVEQELTRLDESP